jgi:NAD-dependent deacetylase
LFQDQSEGHGRLADAIACLRASSRVVALTGAGVSTPSGIPDFRSPGSGLWEKDDPAVVASLSSFRRDPRPFFDWIRPLVQKAEQARPNAAHLALVALEEAGRLDWVVTQNIDGLHTRAGSRRVLEVHGSLRTATCQRCGEKAVGLAALSRAEPPVPRCACGGVLKPDIVFFEEALPREVFDRAKRAAMECELMLVVGSSLEVMPVGYLPSIAVETGARLIVVNRDPTGMDGEADVLLRGDVAEVLPRLVTGALQ